MCFKCFPKFHRTLVKSCHDLCLLSVIVKWCAKAYPRLQPKTLDIDPQTTGKEGIMGVKANAGGSFR